MPDHLDDLLSSPQTTLQAFQNTFSGKNCPATAGAVSRFLTSGEATPAQRVLAGGGFVNCGAPFQAASVPQIVRAVGRRDHGFHVVIAAYHRQRGLEHYANVVNIRDTVYYIDAYTTPSVFTERILDALDWATHFEYTENFAPRFVPAGVAARCPE